MPTEDETLIQFLDDEKLTHFIKEFREEIQETVISLKSEVVMEFDSDSSAKMFHPSTITAALMLTAYDYCQDQQVKPEQFISAMRAIADKMEMDLCPRSEDNTG